MDGQPHRSERGGVNESNALQFRDSKTEEATRRRAFFRSPPFSLSRLNEREINRRLLCREAACAPSFGLDEHSDYHRASFAVQA